MTTMHIKSIHSRVLCLWSFFVLLNCDGLAFDSFLTFELRTKQQKHTSSRYFTNSGSFEAKIQSDVGSLKAHPQKRESCSEGFDRSFSEHEAGSSSTPDPFESSASTRPIPERVPGSKLPGTRSPPVVGDPQKKVEKEYSVNTILEELAKIQEQGPQKYCVLGTRHCSYLHQRIIELLAYALVLSGNHVYTSGAGGTHAATIRGALRAKQPELLTVVLPQSLGKQPKESQELLKEVEDIITMPENDCLSLDVASRKCNSYLLSCTDHLISFAFHESKTVIEAAKEARKLDKLVTTLFLD